mmetsp:Transcript_2709/g.5922  ORF Transcript_2709/g.5922 Transcript_2709/m.5922 type:complete len:317 (+) Transcript_2709:95-1045(+)
MPRPLCRQAQLTHRSAHRDTAAGLLALTFGVRLPLRSLGALHRARRQLPRVGVGHAGGEVVGDGVVAEQEGDLAEAEQVLERVLRADARDDRVGRRERRGALAGPLLLLRLDRRRLQPAGAAGDDELHVARHGVVADDGVHERQLQLVAHRLEDLPCLPVVDTADDHAHGRLPVERATRHCLLELLPVLLRGDVDVVHLEDRVWVELRAVVPARHRLVPPRLLRPVEHLVHVGQLDGVVVVDDDLAYAAPGEHLTHAHAHATYADDGHGEVAHGLVVLHHAQALQRHQPRVRVGVDDLRAHRLHLLPPHSPGPGRR